MRRLLLIPLALVAFALVPAASASAANSVSGACSIAGLAHFTPTGLTNTPTETSYNFSGNGSCSGTLNGSPIVNAQVSTNVSGSGTLSCAGAVSLTPVALIWHPQGIARR